MLWRSTQNLHSLNLSAPSISISHIYLLYQSIHSLPVAVPHGISHTRGSSLSHPTRPSRYPYGSSYLPSLSISPLKRLRWRHEVPDLATSAITSFTVRDSLADTRFHPCSHSASISRLLYPYSTGTEHPQTILPKHCVAVQFNPAHMLVSRTLQHESALEVISDTLPTNVLYSLWTLARCGRWPRTRTVLQFSLSPSLHLSLPSGRDLRTSLSPNKQDLRAGCSRSPLTIA
jgi:hypothetical protein